MYHAAVWVEIGVNSVRTHIGKLTALQVTRLKKGTPTKRLVNDGGGLYVQTGPTGGSWLFRYRLGPPEKKLREMGLGSLHTLSLAEAREKARECRKLRLDGLDPIEERKRSRLQAKLDAASTVTFREASERYVTAHQSEWSNAVHARQWPASLQNFVFPVFGDLPVGAIDTGIVMKALVPIWNEKTETASRVRGRIESILDWAKVLGYRQGENPARWRGHLDELLPKRSKIRRVAHHPALPYEKIGAFIVELRQIDGISARALEFAILTAARSGEVIFARWSEINLAERLWTIPEERMKAGKEHRVPLSDSAMTILQQMAAIRSGDLVFPGSRGGALGNMAMRRLTIDMGRRAIVPHGFRSTFRDWVAEKTRFPSELAELALAHNVGDKVERAYRRSDMFERRRALMQSWAAFCDAPAASGGEVVTIGKRAGAR
jgi:integrase